MAKLSDAPRDSLLKAIRASLRGLAKTEEGAELKRLVDAYEVLVGKPPKVALDFGKSAAKAGSITIEDASRLYNFSARTSSGLSVRAKLEQALKSEVRGWSYGDVARWWSERDDPIDRTPALRNAAHALRGKKLLVNDANGLMWWADSAPMHVRTGSQNTEALDLPLISQAAYGVGEAADRSGPTA